MTRDELVAEIAAAPPQPDQLIYLERRAASYGWQRVERWGEVPNAQLPDVWMYYSGRWTLEEGSPREAFFTDLLEEMESMAGGLDRCRWPLEEPYPRGHGH